VLVAIVLFDRFTALDAVGPYEVLSSSPGAQVVFAADAPGPVLNEKGTLRLIADTALADIQRPDVVVVPGGPARMRTWPTRLCWGGCVPRTSTAPRRHPFARAREAVAQMIQLGLEYDPQPPYQATPSAPAATRT
jgi:putative intracellular protease/amidase